MNLIKTRSKLPPMLVVLRGRFSELLRQEHGEHLMRDLEIYGNKTFLVPDFDMIIPADFAGFASSDNSELFAYSCNDNKKLYVFMEFRNWSLVDAIVVLPNLKHVGSLMGRDDHQDAMCRIVASVSTSILRILLGRPETSGTVVSTSLVKLLFGRFSTYRRIIYVDVDPYISASKVT